MSIDLAGALALFGLPFATLALFLGSDGADSAGLQDVRLAAAAAVTAPSCTVCHPGEHKSLERSVHASFLDASLDPRYGKEASCLLCHQNGLAHQKAPRSTLLQDKPGSGAKACIECHTRLDPVTGSPLAASHPSRELAIRILAEKSEALKRQSKQSGERSRGAPAPLPAEARTLPQLDREASGIDFSGLARFGARFVSVSGNERLFDHDFDLDEGPRLDAIELRAKRDGRELAAIEGGGLEDRSSWLRASSQAFDGFEVDGGTRRTRWVYDATGDWASLSSKRDQSDALLGIDFAATRFELMWDRVDHDERTLASSIGNPDSSPLVPATGIPVDRRLVSDRIAVGSESVLGAAGDATLALELGWETTRQRDELRYARPSPDAPSFTEREASQSRASRRGLDGSLRFAWGEAEARELRAVFFGLDHDVRVVERGELEAFDTVAFRRETSGLGRGSQRFLSGEVDYAEPIAAKTRLLLELAWRDLRDRLDLDFTETTIRSSTTLVDRALQVTRVRSTDREGRLAVEQRLLDDDALELVAGYRYLEQDLEVPDLAALDRDFRAGKIRTHGPELSFDYRPTTDWRIRGDFRWQGTDDALPTETQPEVGHFGRLRVRRRLSADGDDGHIEAWAKWRRGENDVASTEIDTQQYGIGAGFQPYEGARASTRLGFTRTRSQTLTNFYFAPAITPVPRLIRFRGDAVLADLLFETPIVGKLHSTTAFSMTDTDGSLDSTFFQVREELRCRLDEQMTLGLRASYFDYEGQTIAARDEGYRARVLFVFAEFRF